MKTNAYAIYDTAVAAYKPPFFLHSDTQAIREFGDIFDGDNPISKHPEDYTLCRIGSYNDQNAMLQNEPVETLITGLECMAQKNAQANLNFDREDPSNIAHIGGTK